MQEFERALLAVCTGLSADIVRNGEGTNHVMRVAVRENAPRTTRRRRRPRSAPQGPRVYTLQLKATAAALACLLIRFPP